MSSSSKQDYRFRAKSSLLAIQKTMFLGPDKICYGIYTRGPTEDDEIKGQQSGRAFHATLQSASDHSDFPPSSILRTQNFKHISTTKCQDMIVHRTEQGSS